MYPFLPYICSHRFTFCKSPSPLFTAIKAEDTLLSVSFSEWLNIVATCGEDGVVHTALCPRENEVCLCFFNHLPLLFY